MRFTKLTPESFAEYGEPCPGLHPPASLRLELAREAASTSLWQYPSSVLLYPYGHGALFVRSEAGFLRAFLFGEPVRLRPQVWFCVLPYKHELAYALEVEGARQLMQVERPMSAAQMTPKLALDRMYTAMLCTEQDRIAFEGESFPVWELTYIFEGALSCELDEEPLRLSPDTLLLLPPGGKRRLSPEGACRFAQITFSMQLSVRSRFAGHPVQAGRTVRMWMQALRSELEHSYPFTEDLLLGCLNGVIVSLLRGGLGETEESEELVPARNGSELTAACIALIDENLSAKLTCEYLAEQLNVSPRVLRKWMLEETGMNTAAYIVSRRLEHAASLLETGEIGVGQLSDMLGYSSPCYFAGEFKRKYGITPSEYRRKRRE